MVWSQARKVNAALTCPLAAPAKGLKYKRLSVSDPINKALVLLRVWVTSVQVLPPLVLYHRVPRVVSTPVMAIPLTAPLSTSLTPPMKLLTRLPVAPTGLPAAGSTVTKLKLLSCQKMGASFTALTVKLTKSLSVSVPSLLVMVSVALP